MAKLTGKAKADFLARMKKGRAKAAKSKRGGRRKASKRKVVRKKRTTARQPKRNIVRPSKTKRSRGGSASDVNKSLLLDDIGKMGISRKNKMKIVNSIAKRLKL